MRKGFAFILGLSIVLLISAGVASAQLPPPIPAIYSGSVTVNGLPAPDGTVVFAKIEDYMSENVTVSGGVYRYLVVAPSDANYIQKTIEFWVDVPGDWSPVRAEQTDVFRQGFENLSFNLTVTIPPTTTTTAPPTTTTTTTTPVPDFTIAVSPASGSVAQGGSASATVSVSSIAGFTDTVSLTASGLPSGATATFSPPSGTPSFTSTMTISTSPTTPTGTHTITIMGTEGGKTRTCTYELTVTITTTTTTPTTTTTTPPAEAPWAWIGAGIAIVVIIAVVALVLKGGGK